MVSFPIPSGQSPLTPKLIETLNNGAAAESSAPKQTRGKTLFERRTKIVRMYSEHRCALLSTECSTEFDFKVTGGTDGDSSLEEFPHDRKRSKIMDSGHSISSQSQLLSSTGDGCSSSLPWTRCLRYEPLHAPKTGKQHHSGYWANCEMAPRCSQTVPGSSHMNPGDSQIVQSPRQSLVPSPSPLGLTLRKTPSLLDLISIALDQGSSMCQGPVISNSSVQNAAKNPANRLVPTVTPADKLKASNFPAASLKVGTWERVSRYEGDLVGKCYYAKKKLVWEVLENSLKSKIEIQWGDISAMKASCPENLPGTLEIEVSRAPLFFRETNPQPRKHTLWQATSDFTGGQATLCNRHSLQFPEGVLNRHYEKLVQCDPRLKALVEGTHVLVPNLEFDHVTWLHDSNYQCLPMHQQKSYENYHFSENTFQKPPSGLSQMFALAYKPPVVPAQVSVDLKAEVTSFKMHSKDLASPSSVIGFPRGGEESGTNDIEDARWHKDCNDGGDKALHEVKPSCNTLHMIEENGVHAGQNALDEIAQVLLGEPSSISSNEQGSFPLEEDFRLVGHINRHSFLEEPGMPYGYNHFHPFRMFEVKSKMVHLSPMTFLAGNTSHDRLSQRDPDCSSIVCRFGKLGSPRDLHLNIPGATTAPHRSECTSLVNVRSDPAFSRSSQLGGES